MESDSRPSTDSHEDLRERAGVVNRSTVATVRDASGLSWWAIILVSVLNTAMAWVLLLIIQEEMLLLLWVALLVPLAAPLVVKLTSRMVQRKHGVAPLEARQPPELKRLEIRLALLSLPFELVIFVLAAVAPVEVALPVTFVASVVVFALIWSAYARKARTIGSAVA
jgi:hypothetical protein